MGGYIGGTYWTQFLGRTRIVPFSLPPYPRMLAVHSMRYRWIGQGFKRPLLEWKKKKERERKPHCHCVCPSPFLFFFHLVDIPMLSPSPRLPRCAREHNLTAGSIVSPKRMVPPHPFPFAPILAGIIEKKKTSTNRKTDQGEHVDPT